MKKIVALYTLTLYWLIPHAIYAATEDTEQKRSLTTSITENYKNLATIAGLNSETAEKLSPLDIFGFYFNITTGFAGILFLVQVIHGGFLWMTASGNDEQVTKARSKITNGAIGVAIVFSAYLLVTFVLTQLAVFTGIDPEGFGNTQTPPQP